MESLDEESDRDEALLPHLLRVAARLANDVGRRKRLSHRHQHRLRSREKYSQLGARATLVIRTAWPAASYK
jgi:hypothetical protein